MFLVHLIVYVWAAGTSSPAAGAMISQLDTARTEHTTAASKRKSGVEGVIAWWENEAKERWLVRANEALHAVSLWPLRRNEWAE